MEAPLSELSFNRRMKMLGFYGFAFCGKVGVDFFPILNCYSQILKLGLD